MTDWATLQAPSLAEFERLADEAFRRLPDAFDSPFDLLGLFRGHGLAQGGSALSTGQFPNMIWLYRRPILDYWAEHEETLGALVTHVLVHEIGHHFGLSDDDMVAAEAAADSATAD